MGHGGFTLAELLVVMVLLSIMAGTTAAYLTPDIFGSALRNEARLLIQEIKRARAMAILQKRPWALTLDIRRNQVSLGPLAGKAKKQGATTSRSAAKNDGKQGRSSRETALYTRPWPDAVSSSTDEAETQGRSALPLPASGQKGNTWNAQTETQGRDVTDGIHLLNVEMEGRDRMTAGGQSVLIFSDQGLTVPTAIRLQDESGAVLSLFVASFRSRVEIYEGYLELKQMRNAP